MCMPWKPGVSWPDAVVLTVTVANPPENTNSAVATDVPSAVFRSAGRVSPAVVVVASAPWPASPADGGGEPVHTGGVVPGCVATGSDGEQAAAIGTMSAAAARRRSGAEIGQPES